MECLGATAESLGSKGGLVGGSIHGQGSHVGQAAPDDNSNNPLRHRLENTANSLSSDPCLRTGGDSHTMDV